MPTDLFAQIENAVLDLQASDLQSYGRPLKTLGGLLGNSDLENANNALTAGLDVDVFLTESFKSQGGMVGSARLAWPDSDDQRLGLTLLLIKKFSENPEEIILFSYTYFTGSQLLAGFHSVVRQMVIPFIRDYQEYVTNCGRVAPRFTPVMSNKMFIVHGHNGETRETVARYIERLGFEVVILHERPNKGRTIITKFREEASDVGFAVVLMTPDDVGCAAPEASANLNSRARQNVVFELGFFIGVLGPDRVVAIVKGDIERPSDFDGVVYIAFENGSWPVQLAKELKAAGYTIDWDRVMS